MNRFDHTGRHQQKYYIRLALAAGLLLSSCAGHQGLHRHKDLNRMIFSPNGEPLNGGQLGRPTCEVVMTGWFQRVDSNRDGTIDMNEYLADARLQFQRMDIDHNGYLDSEELERFRLPYRQMPVDHSWVDMGEQGQAAPTPSSSPASGQHHRHGGMNGNTSGSSAASPPQSQDSETAVDPVMSADTNLDNRVTPQEFLAHAQRAFMSLDSNHDNVLSPVEIQTLCAPAK